jgi:hypothetical protein
VSKVFNARKVFLCLRPEIFNLPNEHITLEYIGHEPAWNELQETATTWLHVFNGLPVTVAVNGYANWRAKDDYHNVALIEFKEYPTLSFSKNWHITLESSRQPLKPIMFDKDMDYWKHDYCTTLWIGYSDENNVKKFVEFHNAHHLVRTMADNG